MLAFTFEQGHLFLTIQVFDETSKRILWIERNELKYYPEPWDIRFEGRNLTVREGRGRFLIDIVFSPPDRIEVRRARLGLNGLEFLVCPDLLYYTNQFISFKQIDVSGFKVVIMAGKPIRTQAGLPISAAMVLGDRNRGHINREAVDQWIREVSK